MAVIERTYTIPLRKEFQKAPMYRRAKKAVIALREFLVRHMKASDVKLGQQLNNSLWTRGIKHPPHHVKVTAVRGEDGVVKAELFGVKYEDKKKGQPAEEKKGQKTDEHNHVHAEGEEHAHEHEEKKTVAKPAEKEVKKEAGEKKPAEKKAKEAKAPAAKKAATKKAAKTE